MVKPRNAGKIGGESRVKCKYCKSIIENGSLYCRFCGARLFQQQKKELTVPKPKQLADGRWVGQLMIDGKRMSVYGATQEQYEINARATKAQIISVRNAPLRLTLGSAIDKYIASVTNVLSASTIRGYNYIRRGRFKAYMDSFISDIDWQEMVNADSELYSPHTVRNSWGLVSASLKATGEAVPKIHLPKNKQKELAFLNFAEIQVFLDAIRDDPAELAAILALHSLRSSELTALMAEDISGGFIRVDKSRVMGDGNVFVNKDTTKTKQSTRMIPVMIPRLAEILPNKGMLVKAHPNTLRSRINRICKRNDLPLVGLHGLRRSFASLAYHLKWSERTVMKIGGWSNLQTVHKFYIKLSQFDVNQDVKNMKDYYGFTTEEP